MKVCSISLLLKEMQIKNRKKYRYMPTKMATKGHYQVLVRNVSFTEGEGAYWDSLFGPRWAFSGEGGDTPNLPSCNPLLGIGTYRRESRAFLPQNTHGNVYNHFIISSTSQKQLKCPGTVE